MNYTKQTSIRDPYQKQRELAAEYLPEIKDFIMNEMNCFASILVFIRQNQYLIDKCLSMTDKFLSEWAYYWARCIGNKDVMINQVTESEWAFDWAMRIGNKEIMIDRITESRWAYMWAMYIGNRDVMCSRITEPKWVNKFQRIDSDGE